MTLGELVDEYLAMHQAAPVAIAKLRWPLGKATAVLGEKRLADLSPRDVYAWRLTIPEGHRFEVTGASRDLLARREHPKPGRGDHIHVEVRCGRSPGSNRDSWRTRSTTGPPSRLPRRAGHPRAQCAYERLEAGLRGRHARGRLTGREFRLRRAWGGGTLAVRATARPRRDRSSTCGLRRRRGNPGNRRSTRGEHLFLQALRQALRPAA